LTNYTNLWKLNVVDKFQNLHQFVGIEQDAESI